MASVVNDLALIMQPTATDEAVSAAMAAPDAGTISVETTAEVPVEERPILDPSRFAPRPHDEVGAEAERDMKVVNGARIARINANGVGPSATVPLGARTR